MPVYAPTAGFAGHQRHPRILFFIVGGHALLVGAVMTAKMEGIERFVPTMTQVELIPVSKPPPPEVPPPVPTPQPKAQDSYVDHQPVIVPVPALTDDLESIPAPLPPNPAPEPDTGADLAQTSPVPEPVRAGPRFATPDWALRPPYPDDKRRLEEEAVLRLKLSINERGRVVAVEPVGRADRSFLEAARKHLISHWRYKPATEDGRPVPSSTVITLRFELEG